MKKYLLTAAAILAGLPAFGQDVEIGKRNIDMRPTEKRSLTLKPSERNPYSKRVATNEDEAEVQSSEEIAIRKRLRDLSVSGSSRSRNGLRLLLGDILLERGMVLPQLVPNQTQHLKVVDVAMEKIVFGWLDLETGALTGKTMQVAYDLAPSVSYVLQGQVGGTGSARPGKHKKERDMGVLKPKRPAIQSDFLHQ